VLQRIAITAVSAIFLAGMVVPVAAQRCVRIEADPARSAITLTNGSVITQSTPANFCDLQPGLTYKLTISSPGHEKRMLKFSFSDYGQPPDFSRVWPWMTARSVVLPGWGQTSMGENWRAAETWILLITDGFKVWQVYKDYTESKSNYDNMLALTQASQTQEQLERRTAETNKLAGDTNAYRESLILTAALGGWVYLHNVVETYLLSASPKKTRLEASDFKVATPRKSASRAALRSLFFPGLGQRYVGNSGRAFLFRSGIFVLALFTIDAKLRYDLAVVDRNATATEYNLASSVAERQSLALELAIQQDSVENRKDRTIFFAAATGALWLANVFEAWGAAARKEASSSERFEMSTTYRNSTVYQEFRLSF
jgi:hypothetical protein